VCLSLSATFDRLHVILIVGMMESIIALGKRRSFLTI
jgi:hypothetical protein